MAADSRQPPSPRLTCTHTDRAAHPFTFAVFIRQVFTKRTLCWHRARYPRDLHG